MNAPNQTFDVGEPNSFARHSWRHWLLLAVGPLMAALVFWGVPSSYTNLSGEVIEFGTAGRATLAVLVWMSCWWMTEATDITTTALLPLVLFPLLGIRDMAATAAPYADPVVFLFLGGFLLAIAMQRWGLGERVALQMLRWVGTRPSSIVAGFMLVTATFSGFVSNIATVAMLLPIALSIARLLDDTANASTTAQNPTQIAKFNSCLLLALAYASSVGGMATKIGTAPNTILVGFLERNPTADQPPITFLDWMLFGVPLAAILLVAIWLILTQFVFRLPPGMLQGVSSILERESLKLGSVNRGEWVTGTVFAITVVLWITCPWLKSWSWPGGTEAEPDARWFPLAGLTETGIAIAAGVILFLIPVPPTTAGGRRQFVLDWSVTQSLPWNVLLLFGGGLSLASAVQANGVAEFLGARLQFLAGLPGWFVVLCVVAIVVFLTELTSNTSTTASLLPVAAALAPIVGVPVMVLALSVALSSSCAFMLPVATPPNALVYSSGQIKSSEMRNAGFWINLAAIAILTPFILYVIPWIMNWMHD